MIKLPLLADSSQVTFPELMLNVDIHYFSLENLKMDLKLQVKTVDGAFHEVSEILIPGKYLETQVKPLSNMGPFYFSPDAKIEIGDRGRNYVERFVIKDEAREFGVTPFLIRTVNEADSLTLVPQLYSEFLTLNLSDESIHDVRDAFLNHYLRRQIVGVFNPAINRRCVALLGFQTKPIGRVAGICGTPSDDENAEQNVIELAKILKYLGRGRRGLSKSIQTQTSTQLKAQPVQEEIIPLDHVYNPEKE